MPLARLADRARRGALRGRATLATLAALAAIAAPARAQQVTQSDVSGGMVVGSDAVPGAYSPPIGTTNQIMAFISANATSSFIDAVRRLKVELLAQSLFVLDGTPGALLHPETAGRIRASAELQQAAYDVLFATGLVDAKADAAIERLIAGLVPAGAPPSRAAEARTMVELLRGIGQRGVQANPRFFNTGLALQLQLAVRSLDAFVVTSPDAFLVEPPQEFLVLHAALGKLASP